MQAKARGLRMRETGDTRSRGELTSSGPGPPAVLYFLPYDLSSSRLISAEGTSL